MTAGKPASGSAPAECGSVSVAMCTFNGEAFVARQVQSILDQSHLPTELVVADDGSSDATTDIVRETVARHPRGQHVRVRFLSAATESPLGPAKNFERAIAACASPFIALADQDDIWCSTKLERQLSALHADPAVDLVVTNARLIDARGFPLGKNIFQHSRFKRWRGFKTRDDPFSRLLQDNFAPGMTFLMRRSLAERALPVPNGWLHDYWIFLVSACGAGTAVLREELVGYRIHTANAVGRHAAVRWAPISRAWKRWTLLRRGPQVTDLWRDQRRAWTQSETRVRELAQRYPERSVSLGRKLAFERCRLMSYGSRRKDVQEVLRLARRGDYRLFNSKPIEACMWDLALAVAGKHSEREHNWPRS